MTKIQWTHPPGYRGEIWNMVRGCSRTVALGAGGRSECGDAQGGGCYAERDGGRWCNEGGPYAGLVRLTGKGPRWTGEVRVVDERILQPLRQVARRCYFVASTSDPFHHQVGDATRDSMLAVASLGFQHRYILLTKHGADNGSLRRYMLDPETPNRIADVVVNIGRSWGKRLHALLVRLTASRLRDRTLWPIPGLILGVSAGLQAALDARVPELAAVPAWRRVVSVEPLLEPVTLEGNPSGRDSRHYLTRAGIHWIIVGGESGPRSRPCELTAALGIADQCEAAGVNYFFKQAGRNPTLNGRQLPTLIDGHGGDMEELRQVLVDAAPADFPIDALLRREFPNLEVTP